MMFFAIAVFLVVLTLFALDLVHRTPAALAGAILLVLVGGISDHEALEAVHWGTPGVLSDLPTLHTRRSIGFPRQRDHRTLDVSGDHGHCPHFGGGSDPLPHSG